MLDFADMCNLSHTYDGKTSFMIVCKNQLETVCEKLLTDYCDECCLDYINDEYGTVLMFACATSTTDICMKLLEHTDKFNVSYQHNEKGTALIIACKNQMKLVPSKILSLCDISTLDVVDPSNKTYNAFAYGCKYNMVQLCMDMLSYPDKLGLRDANTRSNIFVHIKKNQMTSVLQMILKYRPSDAKTILQEYLDDVIFQTVISCVDSTEIIGKIVLLNEYNKLTKDSSATDKCFACFEEDNNSYYSIPECNHIISMCDDCKPTITQRCCPVCRGTTDGIAKSFIIA